MTSNGPGFKDDVVAGGVDSLKRRKLLSNNASLFLNSEVIKKYGIKFEGGYHEIQHSNNAQDSIRST